MKFEQKVGKINSLETSIEFLETGFQYRFKEVAPFAVNDKKEVFFNYSVITDDEQVVRYKRSFVAVLYTIVAVLVLIGHVTFVATEMSTKMVSGPIASFFVENSRVLFWGYLIGAVTFYRTVIIKKMLRVTMSNGGFVTFLVNKDTNLILAEMKRRRKDYVREVYLKDEETKSYLRVETVDWLLSIDVISRDEYAELVTLAKKNTEKKNSGVGFGKEE